MICEVPYTSGGIHLCPILPVAFKSSSSAIRVLGIVDSGADNILVPYLVGVQLGLHSPDASEKLSISGGIGGTLSHVLRDCELHLENNTTKKRYEFNAQVHWIYPDPKRAERKSKLENQIVTLRQRAMTLTSNTPMSEKIRTQFTQAKQELQSIDALLNPPLLLGRSFFDFFEEITFSHGCTTDPNRRCFTYKVRPDAPARIIPLP